MEDVALLKKIAFFESLNTVDLTFISRIAMNVRLSAGETLFSEGDTCDAFYVIKEGSLNILKNDRKLTSLGATDPVGEISFVDHGPRSATAVAETDSVIIKIKADELEQAFEESPRLGMKVYRSIAATLAGRLRSANDSLLTLCSLEKA